MSYLFTKQSQRALGAAYDAAYDRRSDYLGTAHLLLGLIADQDGPIATVLSAHGVSADGIRRQIDSLIGAPANKRRVFHLPVTPRLQDALEHSDHAARALGHHRIDTCHLFSGLLVTDSTATNVLTVFGIHR